MARIEDIPEASRAMILALECASFPDTPWVAPKPLAQRRIAIVTSAALHQRIEPPFMPGTPEFRPLPSTLVAADVVMSHVSINYDRSGFQRDINVAYPIDRLRELAREGVIGPLPASNYSVMGSTDPLTMATTADSMAAHMQQQADAALLVPV
jgi:D-proline reductase (dithiol) PrdB